MRTTALLLVVLFVACSAGERAPHAAAPQAPAPKASAEPSASELRSAREECSAYDTDRTACMKDLRCLPMLVRSCPQCDGGPVRCVPCSTVAAIMALPRDFCRLRAEGRTAEACALRFPDRPERCARAGDGGVAPAE